MIPDLATRLPENRALKPIFLEYPASAPVPSGVKTILFRIFSRSVALPVLTVALGLGGVGCTTTYDYYGRPVQSVDPGLAAVGVAAAGILGYAIAANNHNRGSCGSGYHAPACGPRTNVSYGVSVSGGGGGYYPYYPY
jgi:hypothetical protein